jgi:hypothetical protein
MRDSEELVGYERIRAKCVERELKQWCGDVARHGEYERALNAITKAAVEHAKATGLPPPQAGSYDLESLLRRGIAVLTDLRRAEPGTCRRAPSG